MPRKLTTEEYEEKLFKKYGDEYKLMEEYRHSQQIHKFYHKLCGCIFEVRPQHLLQGKDKCDCLKRKLIDITGKKYGKLTVLKRCDYKKNGKYYWQCKCECGNFVNVSYSNLQNNHTQSCGCKVKESASENFFEDLTNMRFGLLVVLRRIDDYISPNSKHNTKYECLCDCGNRINMTHQSLKKNKIPSCGCLTKKMRSESKMIDLTNKTFGRLTVLELSKNKYYNNSYVKMWKCKCECGSITYVSSQNLRSGTTQSCGCLNSKSEEYISNLLAGYKNYLPISYETQYRFKDCKCIKPLPFDFAIFKDNKLLGLIEYDGEGHYLEHFYENRSNNPSESLKITKERDFIKTSYCKKNNIPLLRIPYWENNTMDIKIYNFINTLLQ